jgi:PST family polysaccharide transporter
MVESLTLILLSFVTIVVTARLLGPADFGIAVTVVASIQLLNVAVEGLFNEALVQRAVIDDGHVDAALWASHGVATMFVLICWAIAPAAASAYGEPQFTTLLRAASIGLLFSGYSGVQSALIRRSMDFRHLAMRTLVSRLVSCGIALVLALRGYGAWSLIAQYLASTILGAFALWYWSPRIQHRMPRRAPLRDLLRFALPWLANEIVQTSLPKLYQVLAAWLFGPYQFGLLGIAFRITDTLRDLIGHIATNVGLPIFARTQHDKQRLARQFLTATSMICIIALPCVAGLAICAPTIVRAVLGEAWLPAVPLIQILSLGISAGLSATFSHTVFSAIGRPALALPVSIFDMVTSIVLLVAVSGLGIVVASLTWSLRQLLSSAILLTMCTRTLPLALGEVASALVRPLVLVVIVSATLWPMEHMALAELAPTARLIVLAPVSCVTMLLGIALVRPNLIQALSPRLRLRKPAPGPSLPWQISRSTDKA